MNGAKYPMACGLHIPYMQERCLPIRISVLLSRSVHWSTGARVVFTDSLATYISLCTHVQQACEW